MTNASTPTDLDRIIESSITVYPGGGARVNTEALALNIKLYYREIGIGVINDPKTLTKYLRKVAAS